MVSLIKSMEENLEQNFKKCEIRFKLRSFAKNHRLGDKIVVKLPSVNSVKFGDVFIRICKSSKWSLIKSDDHNLNDVRALLQCRE